MTQNEQTVFDLLSNDWLTLLDLTHKGSGLRASEISDALLELYRDGYVETLNASTYVKRKWRLAQNSAAACAA